MGVMHRRLVVALAFALLGTACGSAHQAPDIVGPGEEATPIDPMMSSGGREPAGPPAEVPVLPTEAVTVPSTAARFYALAGSTEPGVAGRFLLNGDVIGTFDTSGYRLAGNQGQCLLRRGDNTLTIEVSERHADAAAPEDGSLVRLSLHGMAEAGFPEPGNRFFEVRWDPERAARRSYVFSLLEEQTPAPTPACGDDDDTSVTPHEE